MEASNPAKQAIENVRATIIEIDKLIADGYEDERIAELKELRERLSKIVESYDERRSLERN